MPFNSSPEAHDLSGDSPPRFPHVPAAYRTLLAQQIDDDLAVLDQLRETRGAHALHRWLHRLSGGLAILGPSMLLGRCKALHRAMEPETRLSALRAELVALRDQLRAA
jgi:two-component system, NarL family, capsular synthesis sensor histidine kinase RcsC